MEFVNLSDKNLVLENRLEGLKKLVLLPDYCPGKGLLPVGSVAVFDSFNHEFKAGYLGPDIGCGMTLATFGKTLEDMEYVSHKIAAELRSVETELGSLGSGNHFIDLFNVGEVKGVEKLRAGDTVALIHSGSRLQGKKAYERGLVGEKYLDAYGSCTDFAIKNRQALSGLVEKGAETELTQIIDRCHNTIEYGNGNIVYRKGAVNLKAGELTVLPAGAGRDALLLKARDNISDVEYSMCHGTGRKMSRADAKEMGLDAEELRKKVFIPSTINDWEFKSQLPECYRTLDEVMPQVEKYCEVVGTLKPLSYVC